MIMNVSKGEFDRRVKLLEQQIRNTNNDLLNRLQAEHDEFIKQLEEIDVTGLPADFISDYNNFKANTLRINDVFDANGQFDGSKIKPLTVETGAITVGQRSQQLSLKNVYFSVNPYNNVVNSQSYYGEVTWTGGVMNHYGFGADGMTPKDYSIYVSDTTNNVGSFTLTSTGAYYIYVVFKRVTENYVSVEGISKEYFDSKNSALYYLDSGTYVSAENTEFDESITYYLSKEIDSADTDTTAYILISQERIKVDGKYGSPESEYDASLIPGAGYSSSQHCFYIQIGYISEELESGNIGDNNRFYRKVDMTYGQTTINGRLITTGRIEGSTGNKPAYIDLDAGEIGGTFKLFTASNITDEGETYVRSGMSGITDYPSLWAGGSLTEATKVSEFRNAYYQYPSKPTATNIPASNVPFETPYSVHMFDYTISNGYRVFTNTRKSFLSALRDCEWTRGVYMGDVFKVPNAFIDHLGNSKFGSFYVERDGSLIIGNVKIDKNGQWSNTLTTFIGSASIGDATHHIYWNGSTFVQAASSFLPLAGGTMTGTINSQSILPKTTNTYDIGNESYNYIYGCFNILYPGTNNNTWIRSNAASGNSYGIVFGYGGKTASTTLGKWTYTGLGIGTESPGYKLDVVGDINTSTYVRSTRFLTKASSNANYAGLCAGNQITGSLTADDGALYYYGKKLWIWATELRLEGGNIVSTGAVTALVASASDKRLKKEIKPFNAKQIIDKLNPVEFEWNKKANKYNSNLELNKKNYGLIAQDSDGIIDNLVFDLPDGNGYKGVRYEKLIPILLQAIKEQQKEINKLKKILKYNEL